MKRRRKLMTSVSEVEMDMVTEQEEIEIETDEMVNEEDWDANIDLDIDDLDLSDDDLNTDANVEESDDHYDDNADTDDKEEQDEPGEANFSFKELVPSISNPVNRIPDAGVLSVVNSVNGKRISISTEVHDRLGKPTRVQAAFLNGSLVIGQYLGDTCTSYELKKQGAKQIIYSKELVEQITKHCELDFTDRTSITFPKAAYKKMNVTNVAIISMN